MTKYIDPLQLFNQWFEEELKVSQLKLPAACCLSTIGLDGYPNARFVSLKEVFEGAFIITGPLSSRKGSEIEKCAKAALSFWWTSTERQIRIQGDVSRISEVHADGYFRSRNRDSQIVSIISRQGEEIQTLERLEKFFLLEKEKTDDKRIERPENWGGICIRPIRMEFMEFDESRLHKRELYTKENDTWTTEFLQP